MIHLSEAINTMLFQCRITRVRDAKGLVLHATAGTRERSEPHSSPAASPDSHRGQRTRPNPSPHSYHKLLVIKIINIGFSFYLVNEGHYIYDLAEAAEIFLGALVPKDEPTLPEVQ